MKSGANLKCFMNAGPDTLTITDSLIVKRSVKSVLNVNW